MTAYPQVQNAPLEGKNVLLRLDLDVPIIDGKIADTSRLENGLPSLNLCAKLAQKVLILGHLGRPKEKDPKYSLKPVHQRLEALSGQSIAFLEDLQAVEKWFNKPARRQEGPITLGMLENVRFWPQTEGSLPSIADELASNADIFINDAFDSYRPAQTTTGLAKTLDSYLGLHYQKELSALDRVVDSPKHPITIILGGGKTDKIEFVDNFSKLADNLLIGGKLPSLLSEQTISKDNIFVAKLTPEGTDITDESAKFFAEIISSSSTIVWNGPMGAYENPNSFHGSEVVGRAVTEAKNAFKLVGGGDTAAVLKQLNLTSSIDHLSSGGGALLYYLAHQTLPLLEILKNK